MHGKMKIMFAYKHPLDILLFPIYIFFGFILLIFTNAKHHQIYANRVGHLCCEMEYYVARRKLNGISNEFHIFTYTGIVANKFVLKKFSESIFILPYSSLAAIVYNKILPKIQWFYALDIPGNILKTKSSVKLSDSEKNKAEKLASKIGVNLNKPIVLIFNRDSLYLERHFSREEASFSYHDYRDYPISDMYEATKALISLGYHVVRVGRYFKEKADFDLNEFTDYTDYEPNDLLEVYLFSICKFVVGTPSGLYQMATLQRKPVVFTNMAPVINLFYQKSTKNDIFIVQKYKNMLDNSILTSSEIKKLNAQSIFLSEHFVESNIELVKNTPDEIKNAAIEMHVRLEGNTIRKKCMIEKQEKFYTILVPDITKAIKGTFGFYFTDESHPVWLELNNNMEFGKAFPDVADSYLENNKWMHT